MMPLHTALGWLVLTLSLRPAAADVSKPAPAPSKWTVEDVMRSEQAAEFRIAPDCRWVVWTRSRPDTEKGERVSHLVRSSLTEQQDVQLTRGPDSCRDPKWSPDGRLIAFLSARPAPRAKAPASAAPDEKPRPQLWLSNAFGGEPWPLTEGPREVTAFAWADAETILFAAQEKPTWRETQLKDDRKDDSVVVEDERHEPPVRLFQIAVKSRKITRRTANADRIRLLALAADGRHAVTVHDRSLHFEYDNKIKPAVFLHDLRTGEHKQVFADPKFNIQEVHWARDGKGFYATHALSSHPQYIIAAITELYYYGLAAAAPTRVDLGWENGLALVPSGPTQAAGLAMTGDGFVALLANGVRHKAARYVHTGNTWRREWLRGTPVEHLFGVQVGKDGHTLVYASSTASTPTQWYRARLDGGQVTAPVQLTDLNVHLKAKPFARAEPVRWRGARDEEVEGMLYYPHPYQAGKRYPLIVMIHGGPAGADLDAWADGWHNPVNLLCGRGAFVLKPNYHGSSNYGPKWLASIGGGSYYDLEVPDIEKGVDALIARGLADSSRLGVMGWSNGSILTIALTVASSRYKAASAGAGDVDWSSDWGNCEFGAAFDNYYLGKSPLEDPLLYVKKSPFYRLGQVRTPTLICFGTEDRAVPTEQGWMHYRALQQLGRTDVRFILFPGEPHVLTKLAHQRRKLEEELAWFDKYLFGAAKPGEEALKPESPLAHALARRAAKRDGSRYGLLVNGVLIPETVRHAGLEVGRFEVTRAQYAQFAKGQGQEPGRENYPAAGISFEQAKAYCAWLSRLTGQPYRLPREEETAALYDKPAATENTLDYWAGYPVNPEDAARLRARAHELGGPAPLLKEVGSFAGAGDDPVFDLSGNVAEWGIDKDGKGKPLGGSADTPADPQLGARQPAAEYIGFRVVKGAPKARK